MFSKVKGNDDVKQSLQRLVINGRLPHSMLFSGIEGVGKLKFACELAKSFTCTELINGLPCGECPGCRRVDVFDLPNPDDRDEFKKVIFTGHLDVGMVVPYKRAILVDAVRGLEREAFFRPFEGRARVFIVNDADKMNSAAANALLKTLEEPAESTYVFLITSRIDSLLATIRSRLPKRSNSHRHHRTRWKSSWWKRTIVRRRTALLAARLSNGSFGRAIDLDLGEYRERREKMLSAVGAIVRGERAKLMSISEAMNAAPNKDNYENDLTIFELLLHDVWLLSMGAEDKAISNIDIVERLDQIARHLAPKKLSTCLLEIETLRQQFTVNVNRKVATDSLFLAMAA